MRNHIVFITPNSKLTFHLLTSKIQTGIAQQKVCLTRTVRDADKNAQVIAYYEKLVKTINILQQQNIPDTDKFHLLNTIIFKELYLRPLKAYVPLFIPTISQPYQPHPNLSEDVKRIELTSNKNLQSPNIRKALTESIVDSWDKETKHKAFLDTKGNLGTETVD